MVAKPLKRSRKRRYLSKDDYIVEDLSDGIKINSLSETRKVTKKGYSFSIFDHPRMMIDIGTKFERVGVFKSPQHANSHKSSKINRYKHRIKDW